jgi:hypothetical protein
MTKRIYKNRFAGVSAQDLAIVHDPALAKSDGYISFTRGDWRGALHRWIWEQLVGPIPAGYEVDHENGIRHDCRLGNLRCIPQKINLRNRKKQSTNSSGVTGVSRVCSNNYYYWMATWQNPLTGKGDHKYFSIAKMTEAGAQQAAIDHRAMILQDLKDFHGYTDRHGS